MSTDKPGVAGSEIRATTSPYFMIDPQSTNKSSKPPSPARSQVEPLASILKRGLWGFSGIIFKLRRIFTTPCTATLT